MTKQRVLIIGLDGATFDLIKPWAAQGFLPNLSRLMNEGSHGLLQSTLQPTTAPAWATCITGVNQGKHGLYDFVRRKQGSYHLEVTSAAHVDAPNIFDIAGQNGRHVISINVPYTIPLRPLNGIMVGGPFIPALTREMVYPPEAFDALKKLVPDYFILPDFDHRASDPLGNYANKLLQGIELREQLSLHFLETEPWDLFMAVFMATDEVQHTFWHCLEAPNDSLLARYHHTIRNIYQRLDQTIGKILEKIENDGSGQETTIFILSDHGAGPFRWMINLNRWLADAGYLHFHSETKMPLQSLKSAAAKRLAQAYRRYLSAKTRASIRGKLGTHYFSRVKEEFESTLLTSTVNWQQTFAYALGAGGNIYLNVQGREPSGIVQAGNEYEQLRQEIADALMTMTDPETGAPIIKQVYRREQLYSGAKLADAPDLIIEWTDYAYWGRGRYSRGETVFENQNHLDFSDQPLTGSHRPQGILIARSSDIHLNNQIEGATILDIAPTILSVLGIKPLPEMDGRFLSALFKKNKLEEIQKATENATLSLQNEQFTLSSEEEKKITEHLRSLGYL